jgi:thiamine-monophosphate kinase
MPSRIAGVPITRIGTLRPHRSGRPRILLHGPKGASELKPSGWEHFSSRDS